MFTISAFSVFGQQPVSRTAVKKDTLRNITIGLTDERKRSLLAFRNTAIKEKKNILVLPSSTKDTRQQDAAFISKAEGKQLYRVDLSSIVSKYIRETEKNLTRLFEKAASAKVILFFDEADTLFGNSQDPAGLADLIQKLGIEKNVLCIFWCKKDCMVSLKKTRYVLLQ